MGDPEATARAILAGTYDTPRTWDGGPEGDVDTFVGDRDARHMQHGADSRCVDVFGGGR